MIENSLFKKETMIFVLVNLLSIGIFTLNSKKSFILFLLFLTPNLLVDIGGADKIGWSTHYQLSYFVPIVWVSIVGFSILYKKKKYDLLTMGIILALCFNYYVDPYTLKFKKQVVGIQSINNYFKYYVKNGSSELEYRQKLRDAIGIGDVVSSPETAVYNLIDREIYYYPINIDTVDKVIFHYSKLDEKNNLTIDNLYTPNWGHQDNLLDSCIIQRMKRNNFDFDLCPIHSGFKKYSLKCH